MGSRRGVRPRTFIIRVLRYDRNDWQGQLVDVCSGVVRPFSSFLQLQRLLLSSTEALTAEITPNDAPVRAVAAAMRGWLNGDPTSAWCPSLFGDGRRGLMPGH